MGVDPALAQAPFERLPLDSDELHDQVPWLPAAEPVFKFLQSVFSESHQLLLLGEANGRIVLSHGGKKALARAEELRAIAGGRWGEKDVGCTAIGASLHTGLAARVDWFETYCETWHDWVNQAAPIRDPITQEVLGALNIAGFREIGHPGALNLLTQAVSLIQMAVLERETLLRMMVLDKFTSLSSRHQSDGLVALDRRGHVLAVNSSVERRLSLPRGSIIGCRIDRVRPLIELLQVEGQPLPFEFRGNQRVINGAIVLPVTTPQPAGCLLILPSRDSEQESEWKARYTFSDLIGGAPCFSQCLDLAFTASQQGWPLLLLGESGSGKELFAQAVHNASPQRRGPFVVFSCAGISDELVSAELFGYTEGSYTGAAKGGRLGKIHLADKGTLFLDDVDCMSLKMQASLLRVIEDQRVLPIGATKPSTVDVRIIASSNCDLDKASQEGTFRKDLYYRLNVVAITLPPLRERLGDIPMLAKHLLSQHTPSFTISDEALDVLSAHTWPGNVRELRNVLVRAMTRAKRGLIAPQDLSIDIATSRPESFEDLVKPLRATEQDQIRQALNSSKTVLQAADMLGIHFTTLYRKMRKYGMSKA
jgi:sigma-54 dependent transcriptional regulator, acetoin dehydrogenase operon transcriptional activator AcoR